MPGVIVGRLRRASSDVVVPRRHLAGVGRRATPMPTSTSAAARTSPACATSRPAIFRPWARAIKRGRDITEADSRERPFVAVVSESFVRRYWPNQNPIGRHFTFAFADREVVGVVSDVRFRGLERESEPQVYLVVAAGRRRRASSSTLRGRSPCGPAAIPPRWREPSATSSGAPTRSCRSPTSQTLVTRSSISRRRRDPSRCACSRHSRSWRSSWLPSASTVSCRSPCRSGRRRLACAWRSGRNRPTFSRW